jgi:hypothetical protein
MLSTAAIAGARHQFQLEADSLRTTTAAAMRRGPDQWAADVAADPRAITAGLIHLAHQRGGRGLARRTGDADGRLGRGTTPA